MNGRNTKKGGQCTDGRKCHGQPDSQQLAPGDRGTALSKARFPGQTAPYPQCHWGRWAAQVASLKPGPSPESFQYPLLLCTGSGP